MFTEGCAENFNAPVIMHWALGEKYGKSMINDFNNGMVGFTDWNILLDETGGPNHVRNFCFAPVHGDTKTGQLDLYKCLLLYRSFFKIHYTRVLNGLAASSQPEPVADYCIYEMKMANQLW